MFKRPQFVMLTIVIVTVVILLNLPSQTTSQIKLALGSLMLPLFGLAGGTQTLLDQGIQTVIPRRALLRQLRELQSENRRFQLENTQRTELKIENDRLRRLLQLPVEKNWRLRPARVSGGDPSNWWRTLLIHFGSKDGARVDAAVLAPDGFLLGRIAEVGLMHSQVALAGDPRCCVAAFIQETRDHGTIIPGNSSTMDLSFLTLAYLERNSRLRPGQLVVTSGLGPIYPKGIPIGEIVDFRSMEYGLYSEARVKRGATISRLEEVWVIVE